MHFDDLSIGQTFEIQPVSLSEDEIVAFAADWDPQEFHTDKAAAEKSHFGGLIASGFHTLLAVFRGLTQTDLFKTASMGSPGMSEVKWLKPVRPGDILSSEMEVIDLRASQTRLDRGYGIIEHRAKNQDGEMVLSYRSTVILARKKS
ncbi:MAG: MaoC family dehydratase [Pseudomonadota bacterium]